MRTDRTEAQPLSRELCERLAAAYVEFRPWRERKNPGGIRIENGDLYWQRPCDVRFRGADKPQEWAWQMRDDDRGLRDGETRIPRLEDLLEVAERTKPSPRPLRLEQWLPEDGKAWVFGYVDYQDISHPEYGATPAESVARWLLALTGGAQP